MEMLIQITGAGMSMLHHSQRRRVLIEKNKEFHYIQKHYQETADATVKILERLMHGQKVFMSYFRNEESLIRMMDKNGFLTLERYEAPPVYKITYV